MWQNVHFFTNFPIKIIHFGIFVKLTKKNDLKAYNILFFSGVPRVLKSVLLPERSTKKNQKIRTRGSVECFRSLSFYLSRLVQQPSPKPTFGIPHSVRKGKEKKGKERKGKEKCQEKLSRFKLGNVGIKVCFYFLLILLIIFL